MANTARIHSQNIRWLLLQILHLQRQSGRAESGGWLSEALLRKLLADQGYDLSVPELRDYMIYLSDSEIACSETQKRGDLPPYIYRYRITARGVRALEETERVPGIGIFGYEEE